MSFSQATKPGKPVIADSLLKNNAVKDSSTLKKPNIPADTSGAANDSVKKNRDIETTIKYEAADSIVLNAETKRAYLYKESKVEYGKMNLTANTIDMDYNINQINATYTKDSLDKKTGVPIFKEGKDEYEAGVIKYNYKTKRGQVKEILTKQGEGIIHGSVVKKEPNNNMYVEDAIYTTCNLREPHFCIKATKLKLIPKKKIVTGAFNLQVADVPTLIAFPFGVFPMPRRRGSGLIIPSYGESQTRGFFLTNGGFFWAANDYIGIKILGDIYSTGGGNYRFDTDYRSRYSFSGALSLKYSNTINTPDDPSTFSEQNQYWVNWNHSTLTKGTGRFSASVNAGSSSYNKNTQYNTQLRQTADFNSSVSYSNIIKRTPFSYAISARQNQNVSTGKMDFDLPSASLNMNRIYPLKDIPLINKLDPVKKLQFSYSNTFANKLTNVLVNQNPGYNIYGINTDTAAFRRYYKPDTLSVSRFLNGAVNNSNWTATHRIPISTTIKVLKYFNLTPGANYSETWYNKKFDYQYDSATKSLKIDTIRSFQGGLARKYDASAALSLTTRIYGTFYIRKWNLEALRHTIIPTISYSYTPYFNNNIQRIDTSGAPNATPLYLDRFTGTRGTDPSLRKAQENINFSVNNTFEMKVRDKKDTTKVAFKKVMVLDNFNISSAYNLKADSFNLSNFNISARTKLLNMFDINFISTFDPYHYEDKGVNSTTGYNTFRKSKYYAWNNVGESRDVNFKWGDQGLGRFINLNLSISARFSGKSKGKKIPPVRDGTDYQFMTQPGMPGYVDWSLPWSLNLTYNMIYSKYSSTPSNGSVFFARSSYRNIVTASGDLSITTKWKLTYTTGFDFNQKQFSNTVLNISRDLHCWYATLSWSVFPERNSYFMATFGIKSGALSDLKIPRRSTTGINY